MCTSQAIQKSTYLLMYIQRTKNKKNIFNQEDVELRVSCGKSVPLIVEKCSQTKRNV